MRSPSLCASVDVLTLKANRKKIRDTNTGGWGVERQGGREGKREAQRQSDRQRPRQINKEA